MAIISKILSLEINTETVNSILDTIETKFDKIPNVGHLQVWLQRLTIKTDREDNYTDILCRKVTNIDLKIWNVDWLAKESTKNIMDNISIIDTEKIEELEQVIEPSEIKIFGY